MKSESQTCEIVKDEKCVLVPGVVFGSAMTSIISKANRIRREIRPPKNQKRSRRRSQVRMKDGRVREVEVGEDEK